MILNLSILLGFLILLIFSISKWKVHPFIALILIALALGMSLGMGGAETVNVLLKGFSETLRWIAIIIIIGAFIGEVLQETGGAFRISNKIVKGVGKEKLPWAMGLTGYLVSIPVFVDVAYILLQPVTESLAVKSKKTCLIYWVSTSGGFDGFTYTYSTYTWSDGSGISTRGRYWKDAVDQFNCSIFCHDRWRIVCDLFCEKYVVSI